MQIIPDPVFAALMALPFLVTVVALWRILLEPMRAYLEGRSEATVGARHEAEHLLHEAESGVKRIEARLSEAREAAANRREAVRRQAIAAESVAIEGARADAEARIGAALHTIATEAEAARGALLAQAQSLSTDIAGQVLGRAVQA